MPPKPKIKIPVHVFVYTIAFLPGSFYAYHWYKNAPTDEEFEEKLRQNYSQNIDNSRDKHAQMNAFLQSMKDPNSDQQKKMNEVLMGGRGGQKRLYSVDETLYGTEEGAKLALAAQEEAKKKAEKKRKKKKRESKASDEGSVDGMSSSTGGRIVKSSVAAVAVVGALAVGASFFLGGRRSQ
ncbi:hypothetical protein ACHAW5_004194 [Stephanodiscus triporus]|uniref:Uncharacterized protein n=1 Tax=Stephanodiscus triporus TaxID=2934178 RepID=A0ABD3PS83_9STRA